MNLTKIKYWMRRCSDKQLRKLLDAVQAEGTRRGWGAYWWE